MEETMKKTVIGTIVLIVLIVLFGCGLLTYTVVSGLDLNFAKPSPAGGPTAPGNGNPGQTGNPNMAGGPTDPGNGNLGQTGNSNMVGSQTINACAENPALQIEPLRENGQVVPNAFMGLDLNRTEVKAGLRYVISVPENAYVQYFQAWDGTTWEAVGPTQVTATAWTSWCNNSGWISQNGFPTGQHRQLNANRLPEAIGQWITK